MTTPIISVDIKRDGHRYGLIEIGQDPLHKHDYVGKWTGADGFELELGFSGYDHVNDPLHMVQSMLTHVEEELDEQGGGQE